MNEQAGAPDLESFAARVAPAARKARAVRELHALLAEADPTAGLPVRVRWLERLARWLRGGKLPALGSELARDESPRSARLRLLVCGLEATPRFADRTATLLGSVLHESSAFTLFSRLGLPGDRGLLAESVDRISRRVLPRVPDQTDLGQLLEGVFWTRKDAAWLGQLEPELAGRLLMALADGETFRPLARTAADAALLLATRVSALGLSDDIRERSPKTALRESPLFQLPRACDALLAAVEPGPAQDHAQSAAAFERLEACLSQCRAVLRQVVRELEHRGVSVDVVYRLEVIGKNIDRLQVLALLLHVSDPRERARGSGVLLAGLIEAKLRDRSVLDLVRTNLHLLARKIIERAGNTGEHYITTDRAEYRKMLFSAAGGGVLTSGTATLKFFITGGHFPPFVEGFLAGCNYAASFLLLQALGFTLATKQPSMTAAALATTLHETKGHPDLSELVSMIARITRSQLAAAIGNIGMVIPAAIGVHYLFVARGATGAISAEAAEHVMESLHPLHSGTIAFAVLTGVLLWASSIVAGWLENWAVYRRLPEALEQHRFGRFLGRRTMAWVSRAFARNVSGIGGNTSLGFMLGMTPVVGKFVGLPLEVRHVTLSTGALALAVMALGPEEAIHDGAPAAVAGVACVGLLNFFVSFVLALLVALRAREVERSDRLRLARALLQRLVARPREFLLPPPD
ncbi:MAG: gliding motility protein [Polyangiales bacterium]